MKEALKEEVSKEYQLRFSELEDYRDAVWQVLTTDFFQKYIPTHSTVLDLGCGWGEFINNIKAKKKYGMDLNPTSQKRLAAEVEFLHQDCATHWNLSDSSLDMIFTSNFFEHLPSKDHLRDTIQQAYRCLRPGGKIICLGPNIKYLPGLYWDFWDHHIPLSELSLREILEISSFSIESCWAKFLPYTMSGKPPPPLSFVKLYLKLPFVWPFFGKQFLIIATKT